MIRPSFFLLFWLAWSPAQASMDIKLETRAGLGGHSAKGSTTELGVELFTTHAQNVDLLLQDGFSTSQVSLQLAERRLESVWIPVKPAAGKPVSLKLVNENGIELQREVRFSQHSGPLTLISSSVPMRHNLGRYQPVSDINPVILSSTALTHTSAAYAGVETIVSDRESLSRLSAEQYRALEQFLRQCKILLISGNDDSLLQRLRDLSGCRGHFVHSYRNLDHLATRLTQLKSSRPAGPPGVHELNQLVSESSSRLGELGIFLGGYLLLMGLAAWRVKNTAFLLLLPAAATASVLLVWTGAGSKQLLDWAEMRSSDRLARVSSLLRLDGDRRGENKVNISNVANLTDSSRPSPRPGIVYRPPALQRTLTDHTALFSPRGFLMTSVVPVSSGYSLTSGPDNRPRVEYRGEFPTHNARMLWQGRIYDVPKLEPTNRWSPRQDNARPISTAEERLLNRRLSYSAAALLLPFSAQPGVIDNQATDRNGWLVIRQDREI